jgi:uncharacterized membrane protein HdeD (DUF308 family)
METPTNRRWWGVLLTGLAAVIFGVLVLTWPGLSLSTFITLFGIFAIVYGSVYGLGSLLGSRGRRWTNGLVGLAGIAAGIVALVWPDLTALGLLYIIAAWAIATGAIDLASMVGRDQTAWSRMLYGLLGVVSIGFGALLFARPLSGALALLWAVGVLAIAGGILRGAEAFSMLYDESRERGITFVAAGEPVEVGTPSAGGQPTSSEQKDTRRAA